MSEKQRKKIATILARAIRRKMNKAKAGKATEATEVQNQTEVADES